MTKLSYKLTAKIARAERIARKRDVKQALRGFSEQQKPVAKLIDELLRA